MTDLYIPLKAEYFNQIAAGMKQKEYRLCTPYWSKRLIGKSFNRVILTLGYPKSNDTERRIVRAWKGYTIETILHNHFGAQSVTVFAIDVSEAV